MPAIDVRPAQPQMLDRLARLWYDAWQDAHARILPPALVRYRTYGSFRERLQGELHRVRVAGPTDQPVGFCMIKDDELYQLFVTADARGSGVADVLLADGEARLAAKGVQTAFLVCAIGNDRAARFYEKHGWRRVGTVIHEAETPDGPFPLEAWRYEKRLP